MSPSPPKVKLRTVIRMFLKHVSHLSRTISKLLCAVDRSQTISQISLDRRQCKAAVRCSYGYLAVPICKTVARLLLGNPKLFLPLTRLARLSRKCLTMFVPSSCVHRPIPCMARMDFINAMVGANIRQAVITHHNSTKKYRGQLFKASLA